MQIIIDLEHDDFEDLRIVCELIKRKIPFVDDDVLTENFSKEESLVLAVIDNLIAKIGLTVPIIDIYDDSKELNLSQKKVGKAMECLKKRGRIFEVRKGFIKKIVG